MMLDIDDEKEGRKKCETAELCPQKFEKNRYQNEGLICSISYFFSYVSGSR